jgi:hypothetical protein
MQAIGNSAFILDNGAVANSLFLTSTWWTEQRRKKETWRPGAVHHGKGQGRLPAARGNPNRRGCTQRNPARAQIPQLLCVCTCVRTFVCVSECVCTRRWVKLSGTTKDSRLWSQGEHHAWQERTLTACKNKLKFGQEGGKGTQPEGGGSSSIHPLHDKFIKSRSGTNQAKHVAVGRTRDHLQVVPPVKDSDLVSQLWAWDQDGPLCIGTGNTVAAQVCYIW